MIAAKRPCLANSRKAPRYRSIIFFLASSSDNGQVGSLLSNPHSVIQQGFPPLALVAKVSLSRASAITDGGLLGSFDGYV